MAFVVPSIVEVLINKIALLISIPANDWTAERAIFASDDALILTLFCSDLFSYKLFKFYDLDTRRHFKEYVWH